MSLSVPSDESPQPHREARAPYFMGPRAVLRDTSLSGPARLLFFDLDMRQGTAERVRVGREKLAEDLGFSVATIKRALAELVRAGLVVVTYTGRTSWYTVVNVSRRGIGDIATAHQRANRKPRRVNSEPSDGSPVTRLLSKNSLSKNKATTDPPGNSEPERVAEPLAAAARSEEGKNSTPNPFHLLTFLGSLPEHLRPESTETVATAVGTALMGGWSALGLAAAVTDQIPNRNAGPGLAVKVLQQLCVQPPAEHHRAGPEWCGKCDPYSRALVNPDGTPKRMADGRRTRFCLTCSPVVKQLERDGLLETYLQDEAWRSGEQAQPDAAASAPQEASEAGKSRPEIVAEIRADLLARKSPHRTTAGPLDELALAEPPEALTDPQRPAEARTRAVSA